MVPVGTATYDVVGEVAANSAIELASSRSRWRRVSRSCATGSTRSTSSSTARWCTACSRRDSAGSTQRCRWASGWRSGRARRCRPRRRHWPWRSCSGRSAQRSRLLVDKRFDRARYEGLRKVEHFLGELRAGRAAPEETGRVLADALGDPRLEVWFWLPAEELHVDATGRAVRDPAAPGRMRTPVRRGDLPLATLVHDEALGRRPEPPRERDRCRRARDRDRPAARRGAAPARRGRGFAGADRHSGGC